MNDNDAWQLEREQMAQMPNNLFDKKLSEKLKEEGKAKAASNLIEPLKLARKIARQIARIKGVVTADDVGRQLKKYGIDTLGPAAGSIFKGKEWEWTGRYIKSKRITNHSRMLREWRLSEER